MWLITHTTSGNRFYFAGNKQTFTVGRMGSDLELQADICVSRSHAVFNLMDDEIELEDVGSKYGTYHNLGIEKNKALAKGSKVKLKANDLIRFGRLQNVWKVEKLFFYTVTSFLDKEDVEQVTASVQSLGGQVLDYWTSQCTHLTMKCASVTVKLLHALIDQKYVVTPKYWQDLTACVLAKKSKLPRPELYSPTAGDQTIDVSCRPERRSLFKGKTFIFLSRKHVDTYGQIVKAAGGVYKDINSGVQKAFLIKNNVVVIQYNPSTQTQSSQTISTIGDFLESHSKRIIPEYEIGMAILKCSLEECCNPNYKVPESMVQTVAYDNKQDNSMVIDLSEEGTTPSINTQSLDLEIPETMTNEKIVTSTPYEHIEVAGNKDVPDEEDEKETMPYMQITETPIEKKSRKRILSNDSKESDDDDEDLFQFNKKSRKENQSKSDTKNTQNNKDEETTKTATKDSNVQEIKEDEPISTNSKTRAIKRSAFADFLEKTQKKNKTKPSSPPSIESEVSSIYSTSKDSRKRPLIQILGEDDNEGEDEDEDLFCFGDTQKNKKKRNNFQEETTEDDDLFGFKDKDRNCTNPDEDSSDKQNTEKFVPPLKSTKSSTSFVVPKPKLLPQKISAIDWISGSLGKIKIKNELSANIKNDDENQVKSEDPEEIKPNLEDINMTEDHRKWLESLKNAIEIHEVSLNISLNHNEKSHYKFKSHETTSGDSSTRNFKTFVKKYQPSQKNTTVVRLQTR